MLSVSASAHNPWYTTLIHSWFLCPQVFLNVHTILLSSSSFTHSTVYSFYLKCHSVILIQTSLLYHLFFPLQLSNHPFPQPRYFTVLLVHSMYYHKLMSYIMVHRHLSPTSVILTPSKVDRATKLCHCYVRG